MSLTTATGGVVALLHPQGEGRQGQPLDARATEMTYDEAQRRAVFRGDSVIRQGEMATRSPEATLTLDAQGNSLRSLVAGSPVDVTFGPRRASGARATYEPGPGTLTIVVQEVGATTKRVCALEAGDEILDVAGPMGGHIDIAPGGHVCGVGGGFGSAALLCLMREFTARGDRTTAILGARSKDLLILADELKPLCHSVEICTDDGSAGFKGFVTQRLAQLIDGDGPGRQANAFIAAATINSMESTSVPSRSKRTAGPWGPGPGIDASACDID